MYIKKFYDIEASESGATEQEAVSTPTESIASIMARQGTKSSEYGDEINPVRLNNDGSWQTKSSKAETPVAPTKEEAVEEKVEKETSLPKEEVEVPKHQKDEEPTQSDWQSAIKKQQPDAVLKALGFDDKAISFIRDLKDVDPKMVSFLNNWKDGGNVTDYLKELSKDYSTMPAEDVMRHQLRTEYPKASEAQLDILYKKEIVDKYGLNSYDEDEVNEGKLLLEAKAEKYRDELVRQQQERLLPQAPERSQEAILEEQRIAEFSQNIVKEFNENPYTKEVLNNNAITIGEGADKFTFKIDAKSVTDLVLHGDTTGELMFEKVNKNGEESFVPKTQHQLLVATVNKYGEKFITELAKHYKSLGGKAAIEPIDNAKPKENRTPSASEEKPKTVAEAMAKFGKYNSGGW